MAVANTKSLQFKKKKKRKVYWPQTQEGYWGSSQNRELKNQGPRRWNLGLPASHSLSLWVSLLLPACWPLFLPMPERPPQWAGNMVARGSSLVIPVPCINSWVGLWLALVRSRPAPWANRCSQRGAVIRVAGIACPLMDRCVSWTCVFVCTQHMLTKDRDRKEILQTTLNKDSAACPKGHAKEPHDLPKILQEPII